MITKNASLGVILFLVISIFYLDAQAQHGVMTADVVTQVEKLQSKSPKHIIDAANKLAEMGQKASPAVPYLIELIDSDEKHETLWNKTWNCVAILNSSGRHVSYESQQALVRIGKPAVEPLATALLRHPRSRVRGNAAIVLGDIKDIGAVEPLIESLRTDNSFEVRMWSADALGKLSEMWSVDSLRNAMQALIEGLRDTDPNVRQKVAYALGKMKAVKAVPALIDTLRSYGKESDAGLALFMITNQRLGDDPQKWQEWWDQHK